METVRNLGTAHRPEPFWTVQALCDAGVPFDEITVSKANTNGGDWVYVPLSRLNQLIERAPGLVARIAVHEAREHCIQRRDGRLWIPAYGKSPFA